MVGVRPGWRCGLTAALALAGFMTVAEVVGQYAVTTVANFGVPDAVGVQSSAPLFLGSDGAFYGTTYAGGGSVRGTVFKLSSGGSKLEVLRRFTGLEGDGAVVYGGVIEAGNGALYGTTGEGGVSNKGTIFRLNRDGSDYRVLRSFTGAGGDGAQAFAGLTKGSDGLLYGTTRYGGAADKGTVFRLDPDGSNYRVLHSFSGTHAGGAGPTARVVEGPDGRLYGTTYGATIEGGTTNQGTVFALNRDGTGHVALRRFTGQDDEGANPYAELMVGQDGRLYGSTANGGLAKKGTLFVLRPDGGGYERLRSFGRSSEDGTVPYGPLFESAAGVLHGATSFGGTNGLGVVFRLQTDGTGYQLLRTFSGDTTDGGVAYAGLVKGMDGLLYGTTYYGGAIDKGTIFRLQTDGSNLSVVQSFTGGGGDAVGPYAGLIRGTDGAFYGTSWHGGNFNKGTVYRVTPADGKTTVLHHFAGGTSDGEAAYGGVIEGSDGVLYGTAVQGGTANLGVIYKLNKDGTGFALVRSFVSGSSGGYYPYGSLLEGSDGVLYGTAQQGGGRGFGIVFKINRGGGSYSVLRNFQGGTDGAYPYAGVVEGSDGLLYGVTAYGGGSDRGTVFRMKRGGGDYSVLRRFSGSEDGRNPYARLLIGSDGVLYGTTSYGGRSDSGMVFRLGRNGADYRSLHQFDGSSAQGINALGGLCEGPGGLLYGATASGGQWGQGTLYQLDREGAGFAVAHHFRGSPGDGGNPSGELVDGGNGVYYGTSPNGGIGCGTVYQLAPQVTLTMGANGLVGLAGPTGFVYTVQSSAEVNAAASWQTLTNVTMTASPSQVQLPGYATEVRQFIRTVLAP